MELLAIVTLLFVGKMFCLVVLWWLDATLWRSAEEGRVEPTFRDDWQGEHKLLRLALVEDVSGEPWDDPD